MPCQIQNPKSQVDALYYNQNITFDNLIEKVKNIEKEALLHLKNILESEKKLQLNLIGDLIYFKKEAKAVKKAYDPKINLLIFFINRI